MVHFYLQGFSVFVWMTVDRTQLESRLFHCLGRINGFIYKEIAEIHSGRDLSVQKLNQLNRIITVLDAIPLSFDQPGSLAGSKEEAHKLIFKKAASSFNLFLHDFKATQLDGDKIPYQELVKRASALWKQVSADAKHLYRLKAQQSLFESLEKTVLESIHVLFSEDVPDSEGIKGFDELAIFSPLESPLVLLTDKREDDVFESSAEPDDLHVLPAPQVSVEKMKKKKVKPSLESISSESNDTTQTKLEIEKGNSTVQSNGSTKQPSDSVQVEVKKKKKAVVEQTAITDSFQPIAEQATLSSSPIVSVPIEAVAEKKKHKKKREVENASLAVTNIAGNDQSLQEKPKKKKKIPSTDTQ